MYHRIFITGTDTNVGKTYISVALLKMLNSNGFLTLGIKPVASGCEFVNGILSNSDARELCKYSTFSLPYSEINPFAFREPIAPHIAASLSGEILSVDQLLLKTSTALNSKADIKIIEGVGGWDVPLNQTELMSDFVEKINPRIILVVGMKLGCLNHAIQTYRSIAQKGLKMLGWVANCIEPSTLYLNENIATLKERFQVPMLGVVKFQEAPETVLSTSLLLAELGVAR